MALAARLSWGVTVAFWLVMAVLTHTPSPRLPHTPISDKTGHVLAYALLGAGLMVSLWLSRRLRAGTGITVLAVLMGWGAIEEWTQPLVGRSCELADWYADVAGAAVAVVTVSLLARLRRYDRGHA